MIRTVLSIRMVALGAVLTVACTDNIDDPSLSETEEIAASDGGPGDMPDSGPEGSADSGPEGSADSGPEGSADSGPSACPDGYFRNGDSCSDVDECAIENGGCGELGRATCINNEGAPPNCADIDECAVDNGGCGDAAGYECVNKDRAPPQCVDLNACGTDNGGCGDSAFNRCAYDTAGSVVCSDIDECLAENGACGDPAAMTCVNRINDKNLCVDVDECADDELNDCPLDRPCVNLKGRYVCGCDYPQIYDRSTANCRAARVLVLDDAGGTTLLADLKKEGFEAEDGGRYQLWNQSPDLSSFDTILWLEGSSYGNPLLPGVDQLFVDFVKAGGGLVRTEWALWYTANRRLAGVSINPLTVDLMPVGLLGSDEYGDSAGTWTVVDPTSPLARGLPATITTTGGYTLLELLPGSEVIATTVDPRVATPIPVLSYTAIHGGITVHVNDTLLYPNPNNLRSEIEPAIKQVYFNAVHFSAQRPGN